MLPVGHGAATVQGRRTQPRPGQEMVLTAPRDRPSSVLWLCLGCFLCLEGPSYLSPPKKRLML